MKLTATTFITLDGVMQGAGGEDEDRSNGFELGGWVVPFADEDFGQIITDIFRRADEILLGRTTYNDMYAYWSQVTDTEDDVAVALNTLPKHVATTRSDPLTWENSHPLKGDAIASVRELKERPGRELQVHGSHGLVQTLLTAGVIDEFNVWVFPVVLGKGKRLFGEGTVPATLRLTSSQVTRSGAIVATYRPKGPLVQQTVAVEDGHTVIT